MSAIALIKLIPSISLLLPQFIGQFGNLVYIALFALIFVETGAVVLPFLPGDSVLFLSGSLAALGSHSLNIWLLLGLLTIAAILGDSLNFALGRRFGSRQPGKHHRLQLIKPKYRKRSEDFFRKYGSQAIFLGRFVPIVRTLIPFTAGASRMHYRSFVIYNVLGGFTWVLVALGAGYFFGNIAIIKAHFELIMVAIILISLLPVVFMALKNHGSETDAN